MKGRSRAKLFAVAAGACSIVASLHAQLPLPSAPLRDAVVTGIPGVVAEGEEWQRVWHGTDNADGIIGLDDGVLFAQEQPRRVTKLGTNGETSVVLADTRGVGSLSMSADGRLFGVERTCTDPGRQVGSACSEATAVAMLTPRRQVLADSFDGAPLGRLNDLVVDRSGGVYFTVGGAFYVGPRDGNVTSLGDGLSANGIMLSPDEATLYVTNRDVIVAFDVGASGATTRRRDFATLRAGGTGDGMAVDSAGRLYVTSQPGVQVFDATGEYLGLIPTPRSVISVAFAGARKKTLYVVGSGAALGANGAEFTTPAGIRNNAKTIYRIETLAAGFFGRPK